MTSSKPAPLTPKPNKWQCSCGRRLPTTGYVWKRRYQRWDKNTPAGYYCDDCADRREGGYDEA